MTFLRYLTNLSILLYGYDVG